MPCGRHNSRTDWARLPKPCRYYNWLMHGRAYPAPLWDARALVPKANFLWGSGAQLCSVLNATDDIALVGNGPITQAQREAISKHGRVVRFNALNNRCGRRSPGVWRC